MHGRFPKHAPALERIFERVLLSSSPTSCWSVISWTTRRGTCRSPIAGESRSCSSSTTTTWCASRPACSGCRVSCARGRTRAAPVRLYCFAGQQHSLQRWALRTHMFRRALEAGGRAGGSVSLRRRLLHRGLRLEHLDATRDRQRPSSSPPPLPRGQRAALSRGALRDRIRRLDRGAQGRPCPRGGAATGRAAQRAPQPVRRGRRTLLQPHPRGRRRGPRARAEGVRSVRPELDGPALLEDVDVVVVPSVWWETYSIVIRQVQPCGIPVVASRLGALPEGVREGENGLLFEAGSSGQLADLLQTLDSDRGLLGRLRDGIRPSDGSRCRCARHGCGRSWPRWSPSEVRPTHRFPTSPSSPSCATGSASSLHPRERDARTLGRPIGGSPRAPGREVGTQSLAGRSRRHRRTRARTVRRRRLHRPALPRRPGRPVGSRDALSPRLARSRRGGARGGGRVVAGRKPAAAAGARAARRGSRSANRVRGQLRAAGRRHSADARAAPDATAAGERDRPGRLGGAHAV